MNSKQQIRQFITTNFYVASEAGFGDDASLLDQGIIDSTGVLEVISFLEDTFGIKVEDEELLPENLDSIDRIAAFVDRRNKVR